MPWILNKKIIICLVIVNILLSYSPVPRIIQASDFIVTVDLGAKRFANNTESHTIFVSITNNRSTAVTLRLYLYNRFHSENARRTIHDGNVMIARNSTATFQYTYTVPNRENPSLKSSLDKRWLWLTALVYEGSDVPLAGDEKHLFVNWLDTPVRKQETTTNCGAATVQMMIEHIKGILVSQSTIGYQDMMWKYRERANHFISNNTAKLKPYSEYLFASGAGYTWYRDNILIKDVRRRDYGLNHGHPNGPILNTAYLPYYDYSTGHYVLVTGYDLGGYVYIWDTHQNNKYFGKHRILGTDLMNAIWNHGSNPGWILNTEKST